MRATTPADDAALAVLLDQSYLNTIDFDAEDDHVDELRTWRQHDGADDDASVVALQGPRLVGACLIGRELGTPFLYEIAVLDECRRSGVARALLRRSLSVLGVRNEESISAWVTNGNDASEKLLTSDGFTPVTPPVERSIAIGYYRAAGAVREAVVPAGTVVAVTNDKGGPALWIIGTPSATEHVTVADTTVRVEHIGENDPRVSELAASAMPIRGAAWLLALRP